MMYPAFRALRITLLGLQAHYGPHYNIGKNLKESPEVPLLIIISHLCKNGQFCGLIKKFGLRLRDPICETHLEQGLSFIGYINPKTLKYEGSTIKTLVGRSLIYTKYEDGNIIEKAYIFNGIDFAIVGKICFSLNKWTIY